VPEQLRVVGADDDWRAIHAARETFGLPLPGHPKVCRVLPGTLTGDRRIVHPFVVQGLVGDRVVLDAGVQAVPLGMDVGADVLEWEVEPDVAVEVAVVPVAWVAVARAPHLTRRLGITPEGRHTASAIERRIRAVDGH